MRRFEWITAILKLNWANVTAHKGAFWSLSLLMCVQNLIYFSLWGIVFYTVGNMRGWGLSEMAFLYGAGAIGYGILFTLLGGLNQLGDTINNGTLDIHLARPRPPLLLALMGRMRADTLGDLLCGIVMVGFMVRPALADIPLIIVLSLSAGFVYVAARLVANTLAFWGVSGDTGENAFVAFLIASTNPQSGFGTWGKLALLTIFPAGYIALLPVEIIRDFRWDYMMLQLGGSTTVFAFSLWLFNRGLKRYTSGNRFIVQR